MYCSTNPYTIYPLSYDIIQRKYTTNPKKRENVWKSMTVTLIQKKTNNGTQQYFDTFGLTIFWILLSIPYANPLVNLTCINIWINDDDFKTVAYLTNVDSNYIRLKHGHTYLIWA